MWVAQMLDRLKELGVYDNTEIFITADHGAQQTFLPAKSKHHIPLFYKPFNAKGAMAQDSRLIANYDIPTIFCANLEKGCPNVAPNILEHYPNDRSSHLAHKAGDLKTISPMPLSSIISIKLEAICIIRIIGKKWILAPQA